MEPVGITYGCAIAVVANSRTSVYPLNSATDRWKLPDFRAISQKEYASVNRFVQRTSLGVWQTCSAAYWACSSAERC